MPTLGKQFVVSEGKMPAQGASTMLLEGALIMIKKELERRYWNRNQRQMDSPFENTGNTYSNNTFTVRAYDWGYEEGSTKKPNFEYKGLAVEWYKYLGRGMFYACDEPVTAEFLSKMIDDCFKAMRRDPDLQDEDEVKYGY